MIPKVSIIVPVYNVEKYLNRCIESLVHQTLKEIEIILVDDLSPDKSPQMCDNWAKKDPRIKVIHKERNEGLGFARNTGLDYAVGEYVMFCDSDDSYKQDACERFYNAAIEKNADVVSGCFISDNGHGGWIENHYVNEDTMFTGNEVYCYLLDMLAGAPYSPTEHLYPVSVCILFIKRTIIEENVLRFSSERDVGSEDTIFKVKLLKSTNRLLQLDYPFYFYYINSASLTHTFNADKYYKLFLLHQSILYELKDDQDSRLRAHRFVISDARTLFSRLVSSKDKNKITLIREMMDAPLWKEVREFKPSFFPLYQCVFYQLIVWKQAYLLYVLAYLVNIFKSFR